MLEVPRPTLLRYGVAVVSVALATLLTLFIPQVAERAVFIFFFVAIIASTWYGGRGPGLLATALSSAASAFWFLPPKLSFALTLIEALRLAVFIFVALLISTLITARKRAEAAARRNERWLNTTLRSIGDAVMATDTDGRVVFMNAVAEALTGWRERQARGRPLREVFRIVNEETRAEVESPVAHVLREGQIVGLANHTILIARDGSERLIEDSAAPIRDEAGATAGVVLVFRDATAQRAQAQAQAQLAAIVASSDDAIFSKTLDGTIRSWNAAAERMYGYTDAEVIGQSVALLIPPDRPDELPTLLARLRRGERIAHFETVRRRKDGALLDVSLTISPLIDASGHSIGASTIARDVTVRKQADEALRRSEQELSDFFENAVVGLHWVGPDGTILRVNQAELDLLGYTREEYVGRHISEFHVDQEVIKDILDRLAAGEQLQDYAARMRCKDGSIRDVLINSSVLWEDGRFVHTRCFTRDVTESKRAAEELQLQARVLASMAEGVSVGDESGQLLYTNPAADMMFGYEPGELAGRHVSVLSDYPAAENERIIAQVLEQLRTRGAWYGEWRNRKQDGTPFVTFARITALGLGAKQYWVCVQEDITERKRVEREREELLRREQALRVQAEAASRMKDEFLATVSHELRTPLTAIMGWARLLRTDGLDATAGRHALDVIERNARAQAQLIEDLLDISRIITGRLRLEQATVDLVPVVHAVLDSVRLAAEAKEISLRADYTTNELAVTGDATRLQQVVWNLVTNAVKFTPPGGRVEVSLARQDGHACVVVSDTGVGIESDFLPHVFERFRQADQTTSRSYGGLGLGLAIVRHLVELHGGQVSAASAGHGQGASFRVELPLQAAAGETVPRALPSAPAPPADAPAHAEPLAGLRVLIVDDDEDTRDYLLLLLTRHGARAQAAADADEALAELKRARYDLLLSDIGMPGTDGYELIRQLREYESLRGEHTPAIALTAYARAEDSAQARAAGYEAHVAKPVDPATLVNTINAFISRAG
jgi:PAS domain S-box-containing protein